MAETGIYEWNGAKFVFSYRNNGIPTICSGQYRMSPDGKFILQYNNRYGNLFVKNADNTYNFTSIQYQPS
jgi:hypothetical protein